MRKIDMNIGRKNVADSAQKEISERDLSELAQGVGNQVRQQTIELKTLGMARLKAEIEKARKNFKKIRHTSRFSLSVEEITNGSN